MRDDFSPKVKDILAKRVSFKCSNPECRMTTIGPNSDPSQTTNIGVAAHKTAASSGGPRYDPLLTPEQRSGIGNGIWVCYSCSKLIDSDIDKYNIEVLNRWKEEAEVRSASELNKQLLAGAPFAEKSDLESIKENGLYEKEFNGQKVRYFLQDSMLHIEHEPAPGIIAYVILNHNGDIVENKLPFDISEYRVDIDPSMILKRTVETIAPNITRETVIMKWGKIAIITYVNGKLAQLETPKGGSVNHVEKRFFFQPPDKIV